MKKLHNQALMLVLLASLAAGLSGCSGSGGDVKPPTNEPSIGNGPPTSGR